MSREKPETLELSPLAVLLGYVLVLMIWLVAFGLLNLFWGNRALISFGEIWHPNPDVLGGLMSVWFIFLWGGGMTLIMGLILINAPRNYFPGEVVAHGMWISLNAGIFEEIIFRWLRFAIAMIMLPFLNFITFGFSSGCTDPYWSPSPTGQRSEPCTSGSTTQLAGWWAQPSSAPTANSAERTTRTVYSTG